VNYCNKLDKTEWKSSSKQMYACISYKLVESRLKHAL